MGFSKVSIVAVIAVLAMVSCSLVPAVEASPIVSGAQAERQTYSYVSLGDSMSIGYGMTGYFPDNGPNQRGFLMDVVDSYPHKLTEYLKRELGGGYDVRHAQLGVSASRTLEWRALVDDTFTGRDQYPGDDYTRSFFSTASISSVSNAARAAYPGIAVKHADTEEGNLALLREIYRTELSGADLITYNSHYDFGYFADNMAYIMQGGTSIDTDFSLYFEPEYIEMSDAVGSYFMDYLTDYLAEKGADISERRDTVEMLVRAATYTVISYCANFDAIMDFIFTSNPDANVLVIDTYNMFDPMTISISGVKISVSELYDRIRGIDNHYVKYSSPYALRCYHVDIDEAPMMFGNEFRDLPRDQLSDDAKAALIYTLGIVDRAALSDGVKYYDRVDFLGNGNLSKFMRYVFSSYEVNGDMLIGGDMSGIIAQLQGKVETALKLTAAALTKVTYDADDGSCTVKLRLVETVTFSKDELSLLWIYLYLMSAAGVMSHTNRLGHSYIESCIESVIENEGILSEGGRVYINETDIGDPPSDDTPLILSYFTARVRGTVDRCYMEWEDTVAFVNSSAYDTEYAELQGFCYTMKGYFKGSTDVDPDDIHGRFINLDDNWDTIFAGHTDAKIVKRLHTDVKWILLNWDSVKDSIVISLKLLDLSIDPILNMLEPGDLRALLADDTSAVRLREILLNIGLNCDLFMSEIREDITGADSPEQAMMSLEMTLSRYGCPSHEARMYERIGPTCTDDGRERHYICRNCSSLFIQDEGGDFVAAEAEDIIIPAGHQLTAHEASEPSCETEGNNLYYTCDRCGIVLRSDMITQTTVEAETIGPKGHIFHEHAAVAPTCETEGSNLYYTCDVCDAVLRSDRSTHTAVADEVIPANGHRYVDHGSLEPTCISEGHGHYYTCADCDAVFREDKATRTTVADETKAMTEHIYETIPGITPTRTESGWTDSDICSYCEKVFIERKEIPATGSDVSEIVSERSEITLLVADSDDIGTLIIRLDDGQNGIRSDISIPDGTVGSLKGKEIQFSVVRSADYNDAFEISLTADDREFGGEVYISIQYDKAKGIPSVKWIEGGCMMETVSIDDSAGLVTFRTTHNSTYQITYSPASSSDNTMVIVIAAIIVTIVLLIAVGVFLKKRGRA